MQLYSRLDLLNTRQYTICMSVLLYPLFLIRFYYSDLPLLFLRKIKASIFYVSNLLSMPLLVRTFFSPLKNEYRTHLVVFSVIAGIIVKTFLLLLSGMCLFIIILIEVGFFLSYLLFPSFVLYMLLK